MMLGFTRRNFFGLAVTVGISTFGNYGCSRSVDRGNSQTSHQTALSNTSVATPVIRSSTWDLVLINGLIVDGTGKPGFSGCVAVEKDGIAAVIPASQRIVSENNHIVISPQLKYELPSHCQVIDVNGACVTPGFIDVHTHNEEYLRTNPKAEIRLLQGVTSQIGGNCGDSVDSIKPFYDELGKLGINYGQLLGYRNLRRLAMGEGTTVRRVTPAEIDVMVQILYRGIDEGAMGLSFGLEYPFQSSATKDELKVLAKVLAERNRIMATHIRSESGMLLEALDEMIEVASETGVAWQYSHVKALFQPNWSKFPRVLDKLTKAVEQGVNVWGDIYAYDFSSWDFGTNRVSISEENLIMGLQHPRLFVASDSGLYANGRANHPRAFGNFPRVLARYVLEKQVLSLEVAVAKMSGIPAQRFGLKERGSIESGKKADLVVFRLEDVQDRAERERPGILSTGMRYVFVNGEAAVLEGEPTGSRSGNFLR